MVTVSARCARRGKDLKKVALESYYEKLRFWSPLAVVPTPLQRGPAVRPLHCRDWPEVRPRQNRPDENPNKKSDKIVNPSTTLSTTLSRSAREPANCAPPTPAQFPMFSNFSQFFNFCQIFQNVLIWPTVPYIFLMKARTTSRPRKKC